MAARVNSSGTKVSLSVAQSSLLPDPKLYIWDVETDSLSYFNFASGKTRDANGKKKVEKKKGLTFFFFFF